LCAGKPASNYQEQWKTAVHGEHISLSSKAYGGPGIETARQVPELREAGRFQQTARQLVLRYPLLPWIANGAAATGRRRCWNITGSTSPPETRAQTARVLRSKIRAGLLQKMRSGRAPAP
jgi:hypothetical protein